MSRHSEQLLFAEESLSAYLDRRRHTMLEAIEQYDPNRLLNSNPEELAAYFAKTYEADSPSIEEKGITVGESETAVDLSRDWDYADFSGDRIVVPGSEVTLHIPYTGDGKLLLLMASTRNYNQPRARIDSSEIVFSYRTPTGEGAKEFFDSQLSRLREHLSWTRGDAELFNLGLPGAARTTIDRRRERLLKSKNLVASLGYPLRSRPDAPRTYSVPGVRRKVLPQPPPTTSAPFVPEPALDDATYEHILTVLGNMVRVMEQSPDAFAGMAEPDLRTHFLVQLNGQFEGKATGETFHGSGKTDILLQEKDKSIFLGECKFWDGPASLTAALDQLLDYATWRDAKSALLLFNRNKQFSGVLSQIPEVLELHPQRSGSIQRLSESTFRMRLRHRDDATREIICTIMVFNVPVKRTVSKRLSKGKNSSAT